MESFTFVSHDGQSIFCRKWQPEKPRAIVQFVHGGAEHAGRYDHLADALNNAGIMLVAQDHRGHGQTSPDCLGDMGQENAFVRVCSDEQFLSALMRDEYPGLPLVLFGHSLGSLISQRILLDHSGDYQGVILSGSPDISGVIALAEVIDAEVDRVGRNQVSDALEAGVLAGYQAAFPGERQNAWLSRDHDQVDLYEADPHCGFALCAGAWQDLVSAMRVTVETDVVTSLDSDIPMLVYSGECDPVHNSWLAIEKLVDRYKNSGVLSIKVNKYPNGRHEMLHEINRDEVIADILAWLSAPLR